MATGKSTLPFNEITINGTVYGATGTGAAEHVFVFGSGEFSADAQENSVTTNDGTIHVDVKSKSFNAKCELYGDYVALNTAAGDQDKVILGPITLYGVVTAEYKKESDTTSISVKGKIAGTPEPLDEQVILDGSTAESS